jgi:transcriptional regulator with XRE-family HTH domain
MSRNKMPEDSTPAMRVKSLRTGLGMNQERFAKAVSVTQGVVSDWERGEYAPSAESYGKLVSLAAKHNLHSEAVWFAMQTGKAISDLVSVLVKESNAAYSQAFVEAQTLYPNDPAAQRRFAERAADRVLRKGKQS